MTNPKKQKKPKAAKAAKVEPLKQTSNDYRLLKIEDKKLPVELSVEERDKAGLRLAELVQEKEVLDDARKEAMRDHRVKARSKQDEIDNCARGVVEGVMHKSYVVETRAVYASQMIQKVRVSDGKVVEKRPMTEEEKRDYLQQPLAPGGDKRSEPHALKRDPSAEDPNKPTKVSHGFSGEPLQPVAGSTLVYATSPAEPTEEEEVSELDDDTRAALGGLPKGWRKAWLEGQWRIEGDEKPLRGGDLFEVYLRIETKGSSTAGIHQKADFLSLAHVQRALDIMRRRGLVRTDDGGVWFVAEEAPEVQTEPGRSDPLPEAAEVKKPKRRGARDTGEQAINTALGQSEGHVH